MCLILSIQLAKSDANRASEIGQAAGLVGCFDGPRLFGFVRASGLLHIPGPKGGCGCSFLADSADWDSPSWDMIPATLPRLVGILHAVRQNTSDSFSFQALWAGDSTNEDSRVTIDELIRLVEQSKLGTKTRYWVE
jgi:hypothetical protein